MKIVKVVISVILSIIFFATLLATNILLVVNNSINLETVTSIVSENLFSYVDVIDNPNTVRLASSLNSELGVNVDSYLEKYGIDKDLANEIVESGEFKDTIDKYKDNIVNYLTGKEELNLDSEEINNAINSVVTKYEERTGNTVDKDKLKEEVDKAVVEISDNLTEIKENGSVSKAITTLLNGTVIYVFIVINFGLALIIFALNKSVFKMLKYLSVPTVLVAIILLIGGSVTECLDINIIKSVLSAVSRNLYITGIVNLVIGIIGLVVGIVFDKKKVVEG